MESSDIKNDKTKDDNIDEELNHGGELFDENEMDEAVDHHSDDTVYDLLDVGRFDQQNKDGLDRSREETRSSWSSSEEALAACEGLIYNVPLNGGTKCRFHFLAFCGKIRIIFLRLDT